MFTYPGVALLWVTTLGGAPARAPEGYVFEEQVGVGVLAATVGVNNARVSESTDDWVYKQACLSVCLSQIPTAPTRDRKTELLSI